METCTEKVNGQPCPNPAIMRGLCLRHLRSRNRHFRTAHVAAARDREKAITPADFLEIYTQYSHYDNGGGGLPKEPKREELVARGRICSICYTPFSSEEDGEKAHVVYGRKKGEDYVCGGCLHRHRLARRYRIKTLPTFLERFDI